jgi:pimeloyl-ACP methyl ester carboxylesterase
MERRLVSQIHNVLAVWMALRRPWMADRRLFYRAVSSRFFYRLPADDQILRESFADFLKMDQRTALESAGSAGDAAINPALTQIRAPTLIIGSCQDNIMPPAGTPVAAKLIPNSSLVWIERCGHLPMIERPDEYHRILTEFLG